MNCAEPGANMGHIAGNPITGNLDEMSHRACRRFTGWLSIMATDFPPKHFGVIVTDNGGYQRKQRHCQSLPISQLV